jgi:hypothetical protein
MKNRAVKEMFAIQYSCDPDAIEVEFLIRLPDDTYEFKVTIQTDEINETLYFSCKTQSHDSGRITF